MVNYPWDTFQDIHADDEWWMRVSREYADTVQHLAFDGYLSDFNNGITNGYEWYEVEGGRQDYHTYFLRGREFTLELSDTKRLDTDLIPDYWDYNRNALINYMEEARFGLRGWVRDCYTGEALEAEILVLDHDHTNSSVFSDSISGSYYRYLAEGDYLIEYISPGYDTTRRSVSIVDKSTKYIDVLMCPDDTVSTIENFIEGLQITILGNKILLDGTSTFSNLDYAIYDMNGRKLVVGSLVDRSINISSLQTAGIYTLELKNQRNIQSLKFFYAR